MTMGGMNLSMNLITFGGSFLENSMKGKALSMKITAPEIRTDAAAINKGVVFSFIFNLLLYY